MRRRCPKENHILSPMSMGSRRRGQRPPVWLRLAAPDRGRKFFHDGNFSEALKQYSQRREAGQWSTLAWTQGRKLLLMSTQVHTFFRNQIPAHRVRIY